MVNAKSTGLRTPVGHVSGRNIEPGDDSEVCVKLERNAFLAYAVATAAASCSDRSRRAVRQDSQLR